MIERADLLLRIGNVMGARAVLEDAGKARNADAIAELGRTYDPVELRSFLVPPGTTDAEKAKLHYREAAALGSATAKTRLERLEADAPSKKQ